MNTKSDRLSNNPNSNETCPAELPNFCAQRHWSIFWVLIVCSVAMVGGRILTVSNHAPVGESPFHSANDRSRWATIRALGDEGTYVIDDVIFADEEIRWNTIDKVRHVGHDGRFHFYSSKPPLMPTLLAGVYAGVHQVTGWTLKEDTFAVARTILLIFNGGGWFLFLYFFAKTINAVPVRDWARYYLLACAGFGTFLTTFTVTLNNHLPAAVCVMVTLYYVSTIWRLTDAPAWMYAVAGLAGAFAVANELPALAFLAAVGALCLYKSFKKTAMAFLPATLLIGAAFFATNHWAHGTFKPAYAHRKDGAVAATVNGEFHNALRRNRLPLELASAAENIFDIKTPQVEPDGWPSTPEEIERWVVRDTIGTAQFAIQNEQGTNRFTLHRWGNWYDYPNSYWSRQNEDRKSAVDRGQPRLDIYSFHLLFGHHGIFSLTPIWILALAGMLALCGGIKMAGRFQMRWLGGMAILVTLVVVGFYLQRPPMDRNYGGVTSGLRWVFWLAPIWLTCMLPIVDWLANFRWGKFVCYILLLASVLSAAYSAKNPWVQPWLYEIWEVTGIIR